MIFSSCICVDVCVLVFTFFVLLIAYFKKAFKYWKDRNVEFIEPSIPFGNVGSPLGRTKQLSMVIGDYYHYFKAKGVKHAGLYEFHKPSYFPIDPEFIKNVMMKDFDSFKSRGLFFNDKHDALGANLFVLDGDRWRMLRQSLSPTFTSGKMKMMFHTLTECAEPFVQQIENSDGKNLDIRELAARFTTDVIGSCAFGLDCNSFKSSNAEFRKYGALAIKSGLKRAIKRFFAATFPKLARNLGIVTQPKEVRDFFMGVVKETVEYREQNNYTRNDFMQLLIDLKKKQELKLTEIAPQAFVFFLGGFETSSTTITYAMYELAKNQDVQEAARKEIEATLAKHEGKVTYDSVAEMKYLGQVVDETLRKYPPLPILRRICNKDYKVPSTDLTIKKGTPVNIPVYGIHYDSEYYPDPEKFDPERFSDENKNKMISCTYMPFGEGPRICMGLRFGLMQAKVGLVAVLSKFKVRLSPNTPDKITMDPNSVLLLNSETIYLDVEKI